MKRRVMQLARAITVAVGTLATVLSAVQPAGACTATAVPFVGHVDMATLPGGIQSLSNTIITVLVLVFALGGAIGVAATVVARRANNPDGSASAMSAVARYAFGAAGVAALPLFIGMAVAFGSSLTC